MTRKKKIYKILVFSFWTFFVAPIIAITILFYRIADGQMGFMPTFEELENPKSNLASEIYSSNGVMLGKYYKENRTVVSFDDVSPYLVNALVATEDIRFYEHSGIDFRALGRVAKGLITGNKKGGGSTISQQLAKNLFPRDTTRYRSKFEKAKKLAITKFKEWVIAVKLEKNYTKEEILVMYLNTVAYGSQAFGIKSAARTFFNSTPDSLKLEEAALLVGVVNAPTRYSPIINPKRALYRRNVVLDQMGKYGFLSKKENDSIRAIPIKLTYKVQTHNKGLSTYFREYLRTALNANEPKRENYGSYKKFAEDSLEWLNNPIYGWCKKNKKPNGKPYNLYKDGLKIYTTIDSRMQKYAEEAVAEHLCTYLQPTFNKEKKGLTKGPFAWNLPNAQINKIYKNSIRRSERYRVLKKSGMKHEKILENFNKPKNMKIFRWRKLKKKNLPKKEKELRDLVWYEEVDTLMSPLDSIKYYKYFLHSGFMSMEPETGHVKAYVGGINYKYFKYDHAKLARRQVGSTFKPFVYTLAMMNGLSPCHKVANIPVTFEMPTGQPSYTPQYSRNRKKGQMITLRYGLANSLNQVSAWILKQFKPEGVIKIARKMGVKSPLEPVPSLCVGAAEVTLCEMVGAYGTFVNRGVYTEPIFVNRIEDRNGNTISTFHAKKEEAISAETAYLMLHMMQGVIKFGTSVRLMYTYGLKNDIAGKTGTTNNNSDGWFMGITPHLVSGAWVGGEERSIHFNSTLLGQGANMALPIWATYMQKVYADKELGIAKDNFDAPDKDISVEIDCSKYEKEKLDNNNDPIMGDDELLGD